MSDEPRYVDLTPTWEAVMPVMIEVLERGEEAGKQGVREELMRLARAMDKVNARKKEATAE